MDPLNGSYILNMEAFNVNVYLFGRLCISQMIFYLKRSGMADNTRLTVSEGNFKTRKFGMLE